MGRGSGTSQANVPKQPRDFTSEGVDAGGGSGAEGGAGYDVAAANTCMFTFRFEAALVVDVAVGTQFVITLGGERRLQLLSAGRVIAFYDGEYAERLLACIAGSYKYVGKVEEVRNNGDQLLAVCAAKGLRPA